MTTQIAYLAGGCFWGMEELVRHILIHAYSAPYNNPNQPLVFVKNTVISSRSW